MRIVKQNLVNNLADILELNFIDFGRLNGYWNNNSRQAMDALFSWLNQVATLTIVDVPDFYDAPVRSDWPGWIHVGHHVPIGRAYWNWFLHEHPDAELVFGDRPDFTIQFLGEEKVFGDTGQVSALTFMFVLSGLRKNDLWVSIVDGGFRHILIEPHVDIARYIAPLEKKELPGVVLPASEIPVGAKKIKSTNVYQLGLRM